MIDHEIVLKIGKYGGLIVGIVAGVLGVFAVAEGRALKWREWTLVVVAVLGGLLSLAVLAAEDVADLKAKQNAALIRRSSYEEISGWTNGLSNFLRTMYRHSAKGETEVSVIDVSQPAIYETIYVRLNLDAEAPVLPRTSWAQYIDLTAVSTRQGADRILDRYVNSLDPQAHRLIFELRNSRLLPSTSIAQFRQIHREEGIPSQPILKAYAPVPTEKELAALRDLHAWCVRERAELSRDDQNIRPINDLIDRIKPEELPGKSRLTDDELARQAALAQEYRSKRKSHE
jgi:hypothetical protein